jgi:hypothetical protein
VVLSVPSSCCSRKTNSGAAQNWLQLDAPSEQHALLHADSVNYRNSQCSRTARIGEDEATTLQPSGSPHNRFPWVLSQD